MDARTSSAGIVVSTLCAMALGGCETSIVNPNCAGRGGDEYEGFSVVASILDSLGRPATLGTTVRIVSASADTALTWRWPGSETIAVGDQPGSFTVVVTRPWWVSQTFENVRVEPTRSACDAIDPARLDVVLALRPDAPQIRQVVPEMIEIRVFADPIFAGHNTAGTGHPLLASLEADDGVDTRIEWMPVDPDVAYITEGGGLIARCRETPTETQVVARSVADPSVFAIVGVHVERTTLHTCPADP